MNLEFYQETRYDGTDEDGNDFEDGVHVYFECPNCKDKYAATNIYGNLYEYIENIGDKFECCECGATFKLISGSCWDGNYEIIKEEN